MRLKDQLHTPSGGFVFYFVHPTSGETQQVSGANSIPTLTTKVTHQFRNLGMEVPDNLPEIIEHQICLRQPNPSTACWSGGIGDDIHHKFMKPFLAAVEKVATPKAGSKGLVSRFRTRIAKKARAVGSCSSCGGTTVYVQGQQNLGRAGEFNQIVGPSVR